MSKIANILYGATAGTGTYFYLHSPDIFKAYLGNILKFNYPNSSYQHHNIILPNQTSNQTSNPNQTPIQTPIQNPNQTPIQNQNHNIMKFYSNSLMILTGSIGIILIGLYLFGIKWEDIIYVTKGHFNKITLSLKNKIEELSNNLLKIRTEFLEKIGILDSKIDETKKSLELKMDNISFNIKDISNSQIILENLMNNLENQLFSIKDNIQLSNNGILILCKVIADSGIKNQELLNYINKVSPLSQPIKFKNYLKQEAYKHILDLSIGVV